MLVGSTLPDGVVLEPLSHAADFPLVHYYFHLAGAVHHHDEMGCDFASVEEARREAVRSAGEFLRDQPEVVCGGEDFRLEMNDAGGHRVFVFTARGSDRP